MLKDLKKRRKKLQQRMLSKESFDETNPDTDIANISELTTNLEEVKQTIMKTTERAISISSPKQVDSSSIDGSMAKESSHFAPEVSSIAQADEKSLEAKEDTKKTSSMLSDDGNLFYFLSGCNLIGDFFRSLLMRYKPLHENLRSEISCRTF